MPTTTFTDNSTGSGDEILTVTVSGISGTITGLTYSLTFAASNPLFIACEIEDDDGNYQMLFSSGTTHSGSSPYTYSASANAIPSDPNIDYTFNVYDEFGSGGLNVVSASVEVTHSGSSSGNDYQLTLDDVRANSQCQQVNVSVTSPQAPSIDLELVGSESESEGQRASVALARPEAKVLAIDSIDAASQALQADVRVGGPFRPEDLRSISEVQTFYLYNTRTATRTANFW